MAFCTTCGAKVSGAFCTQCGTPISAAGQQPPAAAPPPAQAPPSFQPPAYQAPPVAPPPPAMPGQRKTSPIVWVLVIILGLFVLGAISVVGVGMFVVHKVHEAGIDPELWHRNPGLAASKMITAFNPNMEMVRINEGDNTITMRDKRTGHEWTMTFDDVQHGRFHMNMRGDNGASLEIGGDASKIPSWIPAYPGSKPEVAFSGSSDQGEGGTFTFKTSDSPQDVMKFYQDKINGLGMKTNLVANTPDGGTIAASDEGGGRSLNVTVSASGGQTSVTVIYGRK
ncbi:MAG: zinc ribbon domain-containing protein [Bryobacteraceae bacterium]